MNEQDFQELKAKAVEELLRIGKCYETGDGVGKDETEAFKWYRMAAERGLAEAQFELGRCYRFGIGVRRNRATAAKWLHQAAEQRHVRAMLMLGSWYLSGYGVEEKPREGVKLLRRAAERGDAQAMFKLGECYEGGTGVKKDFDTAYLWFCRAAVAAPEDEQLYERVQSRIYSPELKEVLGR